VNVTHMVFLVGSAMALRFVVIQPAAEGNRRHRLTIGLPCSLSLLSFHWERLRRSLRPSCSRSGTAS
jgi:hypothetical protein